MSNRSFVIASALLLAVMGATMLSSALGENQTYDEAGHLAAGYGYWTIGDFGFNAEHPPLGNLISAAPLLPLDLRLATEHLSWRQRAAPIAGAIFLYRNREPPDKLLLLGRLPTMTLTLALGALLAFWTRRQFGPKPALAALALFALDPNIIAHGRYITTDMIAAVFIFLAVIVWSTYLERRRRVDLLWSGLALGCALAVKYSALFLLPVFASLYAVRWWQTRTLSVRHCVASFGVLTLLAVLVIGLCYGPETMRVLRGELPIANHSFRLGLGYVLDHNESGHPAYLLGEVASSGRWYYFPVALAVKSPTGTLLLILWAAATALLCFFRKRLNPRSVSFGWYVAAVPLAIYLVMSLTSNINIGLRHLLPIYPFLYALTAALLLRARPRAGVVALGLGLLVAEMGAIHPHYLAFFNSLVGGPAAGPTYLVDSNLDWGQDLKKLKDHLDGLETDEVCMAYFGTADVAYHGIRRRELPKTWEPEKRRNLDCIAAVSVTLLRDVYVEPGSYQWLRELEPDERVGHSIYVYDLRR